MISSLLLAFVLAVTAPAADLPPKNLRLYMAIGQSNMFGVMGFPLPQPEDPRLWMINPIDDWQLAVHPVNNWMYRETANPIGQGGASPAMQFARELVARHPDWNVGIVSCPFPGRIVHWTKAVGPIPQATDGKSHYMRCLETMQRAIATSGGVPAGIIVYQGESDTATDDFGKDGFASAGARWNEHYESFLTDMRADLGYPNLPAVHAQLAITSCPGDVSNWDAVKESQTKVRLSHTAWIRTDDIPLNLATDCVHHTYDGTTLIGTRFAEAMDRLHKNEPATGWTARNFQLAGAAAAATVIACAGFAVNHTRRKRRRVA